MVGKEAFDRLRPLKTKLGVVGAPLYSCTQQAEANLLYMVRPCLKNQTNKQKKTPP